MRNREVRTRVRSATPNPCRPEGVVRRSTLPRVWVLEAQQGSGEKGEASQQQMDSSRPRAVSPWRPHQRRKGDRRRNRPPRLWSTPATACASPPHAEARRCGWMRAGLDFRTQRTSRAGVAPREADAWRAAIPQRGREVLHHRDRLVADRGHFDPSRGSAQEFQALECLTIDVLRRGEDGLGPRSAGPQPGVGVRVHEWDDVDIVAGANNFHPRRRRPTARSPRRSSASVTTA